MITSGNNLNSPWGNIFPFKYRKIVFAVGIVLFTSFLIENWYTIYFSDYYKVSINFIDNTPEIKHNVGVVKEQYLLFMDRYVEILSPLQDSKAALVFVVEGSKKKGKVIIKLKVPYRTWEVEHAKLVLDEGKTIILKK